MSVAKTKALSARHATRHNKLVLRNAQVPTGFTRETDMADRFRAAVRWWVGGEELEPERTIMRIAKQDVPIKIDAPGAVARQQTEFGDASGFGKMSGEYFSLGAGADLAPLLSGLEGDLCQCPHWGYVMQGAMTVTYGNGEAEKVAAGDLFYWPPGHTVLAVEDTEMVLFSPQSEHTHVLDHVLEKLTGRT